MILLAYVCNICLDRSHHSITHTQNKLAHVINF